MTRTHTHIHLKQRKKKPAAQEQREIFTNETKWNKKKRSDKDHPEACICTTVVEKKATIEEKQRQEIKHRKANNIKQETVERAKKMRANLWCWINIVAEMNIYETTLVYWSHSQCVCMYVWLCVRACVHVFVPIIRLLLSSSWPLSSSLPSSSSPNHYES